MRLLWSAGLAMLRWLGRAIYATGLYPVVLWVNRRRVRILMYHACESEESDFTRGLSSNVTPELFRMHLSFLARHYTVVPLSAVESGTVPAGAVVVTFDDGYASVYRNAWPLLRERRMPATVFLVTGVVGNRAMVWANELNWLLQRHPELAATVREHLSPVRGSTAAEIVEQARARYDRPRMENLLSALRERVGTDAEALAERSDLYLSWEQVREMAREGITFGNHTASHPNLTRLDGAELVEEIVSARGELVRELGTCTAFAYPFGDRDEKARRAAMAAGHTSILEVGGGCARPDLTRLGRMPTHATSPADLFADLELVAPLTSALRLLRERLAPRHSAP